MENTEKFTNNKQIIAFLTEQFPLCFTAGSVDAKPLKIGLFQELATRLSEEPRVSKTQLRGALRQYTLSWRYLHCIKQSVKRVDLEGVEGDEVSAEHAEHALKTLKESKEKAFANKKKESNTTNNEEKAKRAPKKVNVPSRNKKPAPKKEIVEDLSKYKEATHSELSLNQGVKVLLGKAPVSGVVVEIMKDDVQVQLNSGMTVKVKAKHLIV
ncbi:RNA chaperone ProQ [Psychromonas sp. psych-6C06]|uniref:RNA chaperone ProQ n=1 Tax=Psychromonas sp. psych-6C06 TaxID=2058089 RepID=UPI000C326D53|nr:RNA chaperone ProQ [Psychromonas sp. psych-6C06]PKF61079.1 RNA chaperone ProQ [Psychromonas sp. psych-6C06]